MGDEAIIKFENYVHTKTIPVISISEIITIFYFEFTSTFVGKPEVHEMWEFVYVHSGQAYQIIDNKEYLMTAGDYVFIAPNEAHQFSAHPDSTPNVFITTFMSSSSAMEAFRGHTGSLPASLYPYISNIISETSSAAMSFQTFYSQTQVHDLLPVGSYSTGCQQMIHLYLEQFLLHLYRTLDVSREIEKSYHVTSKDESKNELVNRALIYIRKNPHKPITAASVCSHLGYSNTRLSALFSKYWHCSITEYIHQIKIESAMALIRRGATNFAEISNLLCYSDPHYFSRVFRRVTGMSPSEYRKSIQQ